jgi:hypothetical protein
MAADRLRERGLREGAPGIGSLSFSDILLREEPQQKRLTPKSDGIALAIANPATDPGLLVPWIAY